MQFLLEMMQEGRSMDRVTRVLLLWVHNHFLDFETDPKMMEYLEDFEMHLEQNEKSGQLRMLNFACAEKVRSIFRAYHDLYGTVRIFSRHLEHKERGR